jgi:hypothetical protein
MSNFLIDEDTDLLAAEFVLGTLDSEERAGAHSLLKTDHAFIAMVRIWERRFGELHLMVEPVDPDAQLWQRIKSKVAAEAPAVPTAEGEPAATVAEVTEPAMAAEPPKPAADAAVEEAKPPETETPAGETAPSPAEASIEIAKPAEPPPLPPSPPGLPPAPDLVIPPAADVAPSPDPRALEAIVKSAPDATVAISGPPPLTAGFPRLVEMQPEAIPERRQREVTIDVIRSRSRWRAASMGMMVLLAALVGLLAAWRFAPDQLPAGLRPAELMMSIGIDATPNMAPAFKRAPPESGFDE